MDKGTAFKLDRVWSNTCSATLPREAASPKFGRLELIAFLFFGVLVSAATVYCGIELFHMVNSGALEQTVQTLLTR